MRSTNGLKEEEDLVAGALHGCDLATAQGLWSKYGRFSLTNSAFLATAVSSPTPDWVAKAEWLLAQGCKWSSQAAAMVVHFVKDPAAVITRLAWLRARGAPLDSEAMSNAYLCGNVRAWDYLLSCILAEGRRRGDVSV
ncbi:hypothetical protein GPECTOR_1240g500 [Gonium pectorale]|uniref:Uncharacterized protein n=1 Tax=Gonium pectorale TaxID=33097 RepID=A0A150FTN1_GONPE|nr:hypothetical protein GPECTOR_1240g500 [Gonium pectorale]|eukprot:KXZ40938.1 hypothetical protein GPECTOR_1240g500 [Gonium pectorale]